MKPSLHDPLAQGTEARWLPTIWQHGILHLLQFLLTLPEKHKPSSMSRNKQSTKGHKTKNITCIYYPDYLKYIHFITQFLSLYMLMLRSCNHYFFYLSTTCYLLVYTCCIWLVCVQGWTGKLACPQWCSYEELASCLNREAICKYHMALSQAINILHEMIHTCWSNQALNNFKVGLTQKKLECLTKWHHCDQMQVSIIYQSN